ncbi:hypothetical protein E3Q23_00831 [Wallemia mellicola]|uniref:Translation initiation factor eIF4e n=1 Tax=Wallemia mellicola TaxID=1708541 RepID=A0A4T0M6I5_9BASI|nr:hypothetical protein E3Q23_00831 [Wallemia mellicola]TIB91541.1 translation initiation factor eIF4e [Wallemia mellicola]TIC68688.1 translation initiation factor eIF4e [Wallemia mellicola]TIC71928.1 translation initiation factor eIF4e [Wallemia mellicola]
MEKTKKLNRPPSLSELVSRIDSHKINQVKSSIDERRNTARTILTRQENNANNPKSYNKHTPSLSAIQKRFANQNSESKEEISNKENYPLQHNWTLYYDSKSATSTPTTAGPTDKGTYEAGLNVIQEMKTVEDFCRVWNWCKPPSKLERHSNYHFFKDGIKPLWEDPANSHGGKWVIIVRNSHWLLDRCWSWLVMGLVGEEIDDDDLITGAVVSTRPRGDRIQVWTRQTKVEECNEIARKLIKILEIGNDNNNNNISLEFQYNQSNPPSTNGFIHIVPSYNNNSPSTTPTIASNGGFKIPNTPTDRWRQ